MSPQIRTSGALVGALSSNRPRLAARRLLPRADVERLDLRDELAVDEACARCATPLVAPASVVRQDGSLYCCGSCARAAEGGVAVIGQGCAHCGAPIADRATAVTAESKVFCCANCAVAPREVEPPLR